MLFGFAAAPAAAQEPAAADHVVVVLDASGSMAGAFPGDRQQRSKMDVAKAALAGVLADVPPATRVGVAVFEGRNVPGGGPWVVPINSADADAARAALAPIGPQGGTPLGEFLKIGADALLAARADARGYGTYRLLVVTDGQANDPDLVDQYLPDVLSRGIAVDVIGVAMDADLPLAQDVTSYRRADDPAALARELADVFAEVGGGASSIDALPADEAFATLAPLPDDAAADLLAALAESGNQPIGTARAPRATPVPPGQDRPAVAVTAPIVLQAPEERSIFGAVVVGACGGFGLIVILGIAVAIFTFNRAPPPVTVSTAVFR